MIDHKNSWETDERSAEIFHQETSFWHSVTNLRKKLSILLGTIEYQYVGSLLTQKNRSGAFYYYPGFQELSLMRTDYSKTEFGWTIPCRDVEGVKTSQSGDLCAIAHSIEKNPQCDIRRINDGSLIQTFPFVVGGSIPYWSMPDDNFVIFANTGSGHLTEQTYSVKTGKMVKDVIFIEKKV